jgi:hypothetical protein
MPRLGFTGHFKKITIDRTKFNTTMKANAEVVQREAIREWLRAVIVGVPVWTGMSMGALNMQEVGAATRQGSFCLATSESPFRLDRGVHGMVDHLKSGQTRVRNSVVANPDTRFHKTEASICSLSKRA